MNYLLISSVSGALLENRHLVYNLILISATTYHMSDHFFNLLFGWSLTRDGSATAYAVYVVLSGVTSLHLKKYMIRLRD